MRNITLVLVCLSLAALTLSCGNSTEPEATTPTETLTQQEALWQSAGGESYVLRFARICFCDPRSLGPALITVTDGVVTEMVYEESGDPVPADIQPLFDMTVEELFQVIREAIAADVFVLEVNYDGDLGFPKSIFIDAREEYADDTIEYQSYILD